MITDVNDQNINKGKFRHQRIASMIKCHDVCKYQFHFRILWLLKDLSAKVKESQIANCIGYYKRAGAEKPFIIKASRYTICFM